MPDWMFFEAVLYWARKRVPWRDLPAEFGAWDAVYNWLRRWLDLGRLKRLLDLTTDRSECEDARRLMIDSTVVRAHQHAAGAWRGRGGGETQSLGRSRGAFMTKVIAIACDEKGVVALEVAEG